jgi:plastocyanin
MKKIFFTVAALALVGAGCANNPSDYRANEAPSFPVAQPPQGQVQFPPQKETTPPPFQNPSETATAPATSPAIAVQPMLKVGSEVLIDSFTLTAPGYIAIHEDVNSLPGNVIATSSLLTPGMHTNAVMNFKPKANTYYWAVLHEDNGDGMFNATMDVAVKDMSGNIVMARFQGSPTAMLPNFPVIKPILLFPVTTSTSNVSGLVQIKTLSPGLLQALTPTTTGSTSGTIMINPKILMNFNASSTSGSGTATTSTSAGWLGGLQNAITVNANVSIKGSAFNPTSLTVKKGQNIVFTNNDIINHTVVFDGSIVGSPTIKPGGTYTLSTSNWKTGTSTYHCGIHPSMKGSITVQ